MLCWLDQNIRYLRKSGRVFIGTPLDITDDSGCDPIVSVHLGHPFADIGFEFLMRDLIQAAMPPRDAGEWVRRFLHPPDPAELRERLAPYRDALMLDHPETPAFQVQPTAERLAEAAKPARKSRRAPVPDGDTDEDEEEAGDQPIAALLPDPPTGEAVKNSVDFFIKRDGVRAIGAGAILPVLYSHMVLFPPGGGGYLGLPHGADSIKYQLVGRTLWETLWLNVLLPSVHAELSDARWCWPAPVSAEVFPWLDRDLRTLPLGRRDDGAARPVERVRMHPAAIPMPRRYRLAPAQTGTCDLSGLEGPVYRSFTRWPKGLQYAPRGWWFPAVAAIETTEAKPDQGPQFVKARGPLRFDDWLETALMTEQAPPSGKEGKEGKAAKVRRLPLVLKQFGDKLASPLIDALEAQAAAHAADLEGATALTGDLPIRVRATAQYFFGKPVGGLSRRELPVWRLPPDIAEELPAVVGQTVETLGKAANVLAAAARTAARLGRSEGKAAIADDLRDALLANLDARVLALPGALVRDFNAASPADRRKRQAERQAALYREARTQAMALFDAAFPIDTADVIAQKRAEERGRLVGALQATLFGKAEDTKGRKRKVTA